MSLAKNQDFQMFSSVSSLGSKHCLIEFHTLVAVVTGRMEILSTSLD